MIAVIKSDNYSYEAQYNSIKNNVINAKVNFEKGKSYLAELENFYKLREHPCCCVIDGVGYDVRLLSYNSIDDHKAMQIIDITVALV